MGRCVSSVLCWAPLKLGMERWWEWRTWTTNMSQFIPSRCCLVEEEVQQPPGPCWHKGSKEEECWLAPPSRVVKGWKLSSLLSHADTTPVVELEYCLLSLTLHTPPWWEKQNGSNGWGMKIQLPAQSHRHYSGGDSFPLVFGWSIGIAVFSVLLICSSSGSLAGWTVVMEDSFGCTC